MDIRQVPTRVITAELQRRLSDQDPVAKQWKLTMTSGIEDDDCVAHLLQQIQVALSIALPPPAKYSFSLTWTPDTGHEHVHVLLYGVSNPRPSAIPPLNVDDWIVTFHYHSSDVPLVDGYAGGAPPMVRDADACKFAAWNTRAQQYFLRGHSNVVAVFPGYAWEGRGWSNQAHWLVTVHHKGFIPLGEMALPKWFAHLPVRVYEGRIYSHADDEPQPDEFEYEHPSGVDEYVDPIPIGASLGPLHSLSTGSLGCFLQHDSRLMFLTCQHVLSDATNVIQPSLLDHQRGQRNLLRRELASLQQSVAHDPAPDSSPLLARINELRETLDAPQAVQPYVMPKEEQLVHVIGTHDDRACVQHNHSFQVWENRPKVSIGVDAALCLYTARRLIEVSPPLHSMPGHRLDSHIFPFQNLSTIDEDKDVVIKLGRTTGERRGFPVRFSSLMVQRKEGDYEVTPGQHSYASNVSNWMRRRPRSIALFNQYLVGHQRGGDAPLFALGGDSGSLCYIHINSSDRQGLFRPWGLLNARLTTELYSYGVASPIDAAMDALEVSTAALIGNDNRNLLGQFEAR